MIAHVDDYGWLCIEPVKSDESEGYALRKWTDDNPQIRQCAIKFNFGKRGRHEGEPPKGE